MQKVNKFNNRQLVLKSPRTRLFATSSVMWRLNLIKMTSIELLKEIEEIIKSLVDEKAEQDNIIDLNAYESGMRSLAKRLNLDGVNTRTITPIKVRVKLRRGQYTGIMNKWICTIHGEKREVTMREVECYCMNVEDAVHSFKESEIESFSIVG